MDNMNMSGNNENNNGFGGMNNNMDNMNGGFGGFNNNNTFNGGFNNNMPVSNPTFTKYLILSILELFCCCQVTGIIALVFTIIANGAYPGDMAKYEQNTNRAKTTLIIGLVIGVIANVLLIGLSMLSVIGQW